MFLKISLLWRLHFERRKEMKEYKLIYLNKDIKLTHSKDLEQIQQSVDEMVAEGWELQQIVSPSDLFGAMFGVFVRKKRD